MREILFLEPVFKEMIWGGNRLNTVFGYEIPSNSTGECWGISAHKEGDCIVTEGRFAGKHLSELWKSNRELFGNIEGDVFPLLVKIIDAHKDLSIQVHPDDEYACLKENKALGKTECWYILDCNDDATIIIGHNAKDIYELEQMIKNRQWSELLREIPIKKGDFFQINPGCVHAIKEGTLLLETQQNSNITYRLYDYDRLSNGKPRELHIEKSIDVIMAPHIDAKTSIQRRSCNEYTITDLVSCSCYTVNKYDVQGRVEFQQEYPFLNITLVDGEGVIDGKTIKKGDNFIITNEYGKFVIEGELSFIASWV